jgi:hypothetical protein
MNRTRACFAFSLLLAAFALPLHASDGAIEINQDCAAVGCFAGDSAGFPVTISQPGSYVLTSDLTVGTGSNYGIDISASGVDLDLRGHTIDGGGTCTGTPVTACSGTAGASYGIEVVSFAGATLVSHIHHGRVRGFAFAGVITWNYAGTGTTLDHLTVTDNAIAGVEVQGITPETVIRVSDSVISRNKTYGVTFTNSQTRLELENNVISENGSDGVYVGNGSVFLNNRIHNNGGVGINCNSVANQVCAVGGNTLYANTGGSWLIPTVRYFGGSNTNACMDTGVCP